MSRNFIPCLGLVVGAAMIAGTPALATGTVTEAAVPQLAAAVAGDLADRIEELWASSKELADTDIDARVDGSRVILKGEVTSESQRQTAERLAKRVKGVTEVDNQIALRAGGLDTRGNQGFGACG